MTATLETAPDTHTLRSPNLQHGLDPRGKWGSEQRRIIKQRKQWLSHHFDDSAPYYCPPMLPGYSVYDYSDGGHDWNGYLRLLPTRDLNRVDFLLAQYGAEHAEHHFIRFRPFCGSCRYWMTARLSLASWLMRNPGRTPVEESDNVLDWDAPLPAETDGGLDIYKPSALHALPKAKPLVKINGSLVIPAHCTGFLAGAGGVWKTFASLNFAAGLAIDGRRVLYIMGEGVTSTEDRLLALCQHRGWQLSDLDEGLDVKGSTVNLFDAGADFAALLALVGRERYDLVVVDTLARSVGAGDQNNASDMSVVAHRVDQIKRASGGTVLIVAHTGKDADKGIRGSSALADNGDFVITMKRDGDAVRMSTKHEHGGKMKDGREDFEIRLSPKQVGPSMVLIEATEKPQWLSDNIAARITGVLYAVRSGDAPTGAQVLSLVRDDGTGKDAGRTQVYDVLGELVREGKVTTEKVGQSKRYRLDASHYPKEA